MAMLSYYGNRQLTAQAPQHESNLEGEKTVQKATNRRTVDLAGPYLRLRLIRCIQRGPADAKTMPPTAAGALEVLPPVAYIHQPATSFNGKFVHLSTNKAKCSINVVCWTPEGRRCMTGTQSGEFTLWNGTSFNFDTILQAHETAIRAMRWNHNELWLLTADDSGKVKYWKPNYELVKVAEAHREAVRGLAFAPSDLKFATASVDSTVKVWDFASCTAEATLTGHGGDIMGLDWQPRGSLLASCSRDGLVKVWDARARRSLADSLHGHKAPVLQVHWHANANWLLSASRDQSCKVFDVRMMREMASFMGHNRDVTSVAWHPVHEELFCSGGHDGSLIFWLLSRPNPQHEVRGAHEASILSAAWHPAGHLMATGSSDYCTKFWCRTRPGDPWRDRHQLEQEEAANSEAGAVEAVVQRRPPSVGPPTNGAAIPGIGGTSQGAPGSRQGPPPGIAPGNAPPPGPPPRPPGYLPRAPPGGRGPGRGPPPPYGGRYAPRAPTPPTGGKRTYGDAFQGPGTQPLGQPPRAPSPSAQGRGPPTGGPGRGMGPPMGRGSSAGRTMRPGPGPGPASGSFPPQPPGPVQGQPQHMPAGLAGPSGTAPPSFAPPSSQHWQQPQQQQAAPPHAAGGPGRPPYMAPGLPGQAGAPPQVNGQYGAPPGIQAPLDDRGRGRGAPGPSQGWPGRP